MATLKIVLPHFRTTAHTLCLLACIPLALTQELAEAHHAVLTASIAPDGHGRQCLGVWKCHDAPAGT